MERPKITVEDPKLQPVFDHIYRNALGNVVILQAAPTVAADMKGNTIGFYSDELYFRLANGGLYKVALTAL